jgi:hypothetical protein
MVYAQFTQLVEIIKKNYAHADNWFTQDRLQEYFNYLKYYQFEPFKNLLMRYISNSSYIPKLNDIKDLCKNLNQDKLQSNIEQTDCKLCNNSGRLSVYSKQDLSAWCFRCTCAHGVKYSKNFNTLPDDWQDNFYTLNEYHNEVSQKTLSIK